MLGDVVRMSFTVATYNVLATAHLGRGDYGAVPPALLDPARRVPALVRHVASLNTDLLCLQEIEPDVFAALRDGLGPLSYHGRYERKGRGKPDGCATFHRTALFALRHAARLEYHDEERGPGNHSGFMALLLGLEQGGWLLGVANTHLRWDPPGTPRDRQVGFRQAAELLEACRQFELPCGGWVVCGDFNRRPEGEVVAAFRQAGFAFAHDGLAHVRSAVANRRASLIDYVFHSATLRCRPLDPPPISDGTVLPSAEQPSDHLALMAELDWAEPAAGASGIAGPSSRAGRPGSGGESRIR
jgi:mRNA deadenylase 3'-5' endonuclease subunit Ccr4